MKNNNQSVGGNIVLAMIRSFEENQKNNKPELVEKKEKNKN